MNTAIISNQLPQIASGEIHQYFRKLRQSDNICMNVCLRMFILLYRIKPQYRTQTLVEYLSYIRDNIEHFRQYRDLMVVVHRYMQELEKSICYIRNEEEKLKIEVEQIILDMDEIFSFMHLYC